MNEEIFAQPRERHMFDFYLGAVKLPLNSFGHAGRTVEIITEVALGLQERVTVQVPNRTRDVEVTVAPWPLMAVGQRYWLQAQGTLNSGREIEVLLAVNQPVEAVVPVSLRLSHPELGSLQEGTQLIVSIKVTFDGSQNEGDAVTFPPRRFTLRRTSEDV